MLERFEPEGEGQISRSNVNFKVKYDSSTNKGRNKRNTFFLCNFGQINYVGILKSDALNGDGRGVQG